MNATYIETVYFHSDAKTGKKKVSGTISEGRSKIETVNQTKKDATECADPHDFYW